MSLTAAQLKARDGKITASFAPMLMAGKEAEILNRWRMLIGDPHAVEENLDDKWPVQYGSFIEPFALDWHQRVTGRALTRRGEVVVHPTRDFLCCTLDAYRAEDSTVIDCKALGGYRKLDEAIGYYAAQMVVQRECVGSEKAALLIVHGGAEPKEFSVEITDEYTKAVMDRVDWFWNCVETLTPPYALPSIAAPVKPEAFYDMTGNNAWAASSATYLETRDAKRLCDDAEKTLKAAMPADAIRASGHGVSITRKTGKLYLAPMELVT